jgi:hypothetical protein
MFQLMRFYTLTSHWRTRLALNSAASNIWLCWLISFTGLMTLFVVAVCRDFAGIELAILGAVAMIAFAVSFLFLPEARRIHALRCAAGNAVFVDLP